MVQRFQFRLEQVLSLRKQLEDVKVRELAVAKKHLLEIETALNKHVEKQEEFLKACVELEKNGMVTAEQVMTYLEYKEALLKEEKEFRKRQNDWMLEVERRRREAVKASRQRQLLENLRDKKKRVHAQEVQQEEQKFLDEVSSIAFARRERAKKSVSLS
ncbi:MAG TPA: flagellar export protein FliJ [bacterium]|nr:flagellar export protein FliJ [bacterium]